MQLRTVLLGMLALLFSMSAALGVYLFVRRPVAKPRVETVSIVVTSDVVQRGVTLSPEMLTRRDWPKEFVPKDAIHELEEAVGRTVWIPMVPNDVVVESKLASKGAGRGMASLIPPGMRAVTIQTPNVATGVAGFVLPGNKVDVLWTMQQAVQNDQTGGGSTATLLQNIEILAVDQTIEMPYENKVDPRDLRSVTLLVSPTDAAKLDLAQNRGTLRLSLRNPEDTRTDAMAMTTLSALRHATVFPPIPADPPRESDEVIASDEELAVDTPAGNASPIAVYPAEVMLPIRTLRGTSSGAVHLRHQLKPSGYSSGRPLRSTNRS